MGDHHGAIRADRRIRHRAPAGGPHGGADGVLLAGALDLERPEPARSRGAALLDAVRDGAALMEDVDDSARRLLRLVARSGRFADPDPRPEESDDRPAHRALARRAAAEGMVLLRNQGVLPLAPERVGRLAVIGPNAANSQAQGGGSSAVFPH